MEKIVFNKEETKNLINMMQSSDTENHVIALKALQNVDVKKYIGELLVMWKYSGISVNEWKDNANDVFQELMNVIDNSENLTSPKTLRLITTNNGSVNSIELFMEFFIRDMTKMLDQIGYPTDSFEINIKLKNNE